MIIDEAFNSDKLIEFLEALIKDAGKKVFLILDNLRIHHSKPVKTWAAERQDKIELFYLPSYSPELNPQERLNACCVAFEVQLCVWGFAGRKTDFSTSSGLMCMI
jgi:transposase